MHKVTPETPEIQFRELLPFRITSLKSADVGVKFSGYSH